MKFLKKILSEKKIILINIFLFTYLLINFFDGERGAFAYYKNKDIKQKLILEKQILNESIKIVEKKNNLLSENIDLDYLETVYRSKFLVGKSDEKIYIIKHEN